MLLVGKIKTRPRDYLLMAIDLVGETEFVKNLPLSALVETRRVDSVGASDL